MKKLWRNGSMTAILTLALALLFGGTALAYSYPYPQTENWWNYGWYYGGQNDAAAKPSVNTQSNDEFWQEIMAKIGGGEKQAAAAPTQPNAGTTKPAQPGSNTTANGSGSAAKPGTNDDANSSYVEQVAKLVNQERAKNGLSQLTLDSQLCAAAEVRAREAAQSFSHTRPNGSSCFTALREAGISYRGAGENIAYGQRTPAAVMQDWLNSPGHRANILKASYTKIGVGYVVIGGVPYWSQFFTY